MQTALLTLIAVLIILLLAAGGILIFNLSALRRDTAAQQTAAGLLQQQIEQMRQSNLILSQTLEKNLQTGQESISRFLVHSGQMLGELKEQLGKLKGDSEQMLRIGQEVRKLQDILKAPKLRGQIGEYSLEGLLGNILPAEHFTIQHTFKNGKIVDALVRLPDYTVPIDAKFPLPAFEKIAAAETEEDRSKARRQFQTDVCKHIDKIAESYILPAEGTVDFALMYIPAENVYYETILHYDSDKMNLPDYALAKKVIPVSPNLLYAYLMTVAMGLRGMQIEKQAAEIRTALEQLTGSFGSFVESWGVLGRHLRNAQNQYEEGDSRLNKFTLQLDQIRRADKS
ncbi:MAG TPA: DNA recombination protein RmuC [Anaerohalosphaeraceae bacterium]|nr:DNA recombination protein RmuC [Anaerohalosphaeraceae bacterium]HOL88385.1 DNA recombination protein RmuC [Anaerohalosphaeraceae bacterium]HPP55037.1 DNA recombination protein RmuC [Anaerohalosphaeraceae bacterium]